MSMLGWFKAKPAPPPPEAPNIHERAARFRRGCQVVDRLSPECLRMLIEDATVLALSATRPAAKSTPVAEPWRREQRPHHRMFIVASEDIKAGQVIYLDAVSDGSYNAHLRKAG